MKFFKQLYFTDRVFMLLLGFAFLFVISFFIPSIYGFVRYAFYIFLLLCTWEILFLYLSKEGIIIERVYPERLSNGDSNDLKLLIHNLYPTKVKIRVLEELPEQLQIRDFEKIIRPAKKVISTIHYQVKPTSRGLYQFNRCHALVSLLGLLERKYTLNTPLSLPCYPSFIQLNKYLLMATTNRLEDLGVKKIRRIGSTMEFDHIKSYAVGDEYKRINWKASAKLNKLMVNQYEDERSQPIYSFIDMGRAMRMPFEGLTLLDYAINATLVLSSVTINKQDRAGLLSFSKQITTHVVASKRNHQMKLILEELYKLTTDFSESEYGKLYAYTKRNINQRALLFLYSNFETLDALHRQLPYLTLINKSHILVVILFKNTELTTLAQQPADQSLDIYTKIIAEKFSYEKELIIQTLNKHGIQTIYTAPQQLTLNSINKYLEIKARGII